MTPSYCFKIHFKYAGIPFDSNVLKDLQLDLLSVPLPALRASCDLKAAKLYIQKTVTF